MDGVWEAEPTPIGHSGHKNQYRHGVRQGNFAEELLAADYRRAPGFVLDKGGAFSTSTTSHATYTPQGKSGAALAAAAQRQDILLKYVKYGRSQVLPDDKTTYYATTTQLAYGGPPAPSSASHGSGSDAGSIQRGAAGVPKVQDCLWGGNKFDNRKVPVSMQAYSLVQERRRHLEAEAAANPYRTVEKDTLEAAARDPHARIAAKPPLAHPRDVRGEDTHVGQRPHGEFTAMLNKDYLRIGLRKP